MRVVSGVDETSNEQCFRRASDVLPGDHGMVSWQAKGCRDKRFRLGGASDGTGDWSQSADSGYPSGKWSGGPTSRSSRRDVLFHGLGASAGCRGRHSHARARRYFWEATSGATSLAHVLRTVYRHRILLPGTATSVSRLVTQNKHTFCPGDPAPDIADFLADPRSPHKARGGRLCGERNGSRRLISEYLRAVRRTR